MLRATPLSIWDVYTYGIPVNTYLGAGGSAEDGMRDGNNRYDRTAEDIGNVIALEHLNVLVPGTRE